MRAFLCVWIMSVLSLQLGFAQGGKKIEDEIKGKDEKWLFDAYLSSVAIGERQRVDILAKQLSEKFANTREGRITSAILTAFVKRDPKAARKLFEGILKDFPDDPDTISYLATLDWMEGKLDAAEKRVNEALKKSKDSSALWFASVDVMLRKRKPKEASWMLYKIMSNEKAPAGVRAKAAVMKARFSMQERDTKNAIVYLKAAQEAYWNVDTQILLVNEYIKMGNYPMIDKEKLVLAQEIKKEKYKARKEGLEHTVAMIEVSYHMHKCVKSLEKKDFDPEEAEASLFVAKTHLKTLPLAKQKSLGKSVKSLGVEIARKVLEVGVEKYKKDKKSYPISWQVTQAKKVIALGTEAGMSEKHPLVEYAHNVLKEIDKK